MKDEKDNLTKEMVSACTKRLMSRKVEGLENYVKRGENDDDLPILSMDLRVNLITIPDDKKNKEIAADFERLVTTQLLFALENFLDKRPECDITAFCDTAKVSTVAGWGAIEFIKSKYDSM